MKPEPPIQIRFSRTFFSLLLALACASSGCGNRNSETGQARGSGNLQAAIKARTEATELQLETFYTDQEVRNLMRKVAAKAEAKHFEADILISKDRYAEAVDAFKDSARLYRQVAEGRKLLDQLAKAKTNTVAARIFAEATVKPEQLQDVRRLETNVNDYVQAGEFESALAEQEKVRVAYANMFPSEGEATLEQAVAARNAMLAARDQIKNLPPLTSALALGQWRPPMPPTVPTYPTPPVPAPSPIPTRSVRSPATGFGTPAPSTPVQSTFQQRLQQIVARAAALDPIQSAFLKLPKPGSFADLLSRASNAESTAGYALEERQYAQARSLFLATEKLYREAATAQPNHEAVFTSRQSAEDMMKKADATFKSSARPVAFQRGRQALGDANKAVAEDDIEAAKPLLAVAAEQFAAAVAEAEMMNAEADRRRALLAGLAFSKTATVDLGGGVSMEFVLILPGSFMMGSDIGEGSEKPVHKVTLTKPFYLGKFEITQEQWQAVMGNNPSAFKGPKLPAENFSWNDCQTFLGVLQEKTRKKFALPTEAQWEYACRAGTTTSYSFGDGDAGLPEHAWFNGNSGSITHPVGEKKPNPWGLYDMHGNVAEWCADWFSNSYASGDATDPQGASSGSSRVVRGLGWRDSPGWSRSATRGANAPTDHWGHFGMRCVMLVGEASP